MGDFVIGEFSMYTPKGGAVISLFGSVYVCSKYDGYKINGRKIKSSRDVKSLITDKPMNYDGEEIYVVNEVDYFGADMILCTKTNRCIWLKDNMELARTTMVKHLVSNGNNPGHTADENYLICDDCIYVENFGRMIKFPDVRGGAYWRGNYWAISPKELRNITTGDVYPLTLGECHTIEFIDGFIVIKTPAGENQYSFLEEYVETTIDPSNCLACRKKPEKFMTYGCGHSVICNTCHEKMAPIGDAKICPVCKEKITIAVATIPR